MLEWYHSLGFSASSSSFTLFESDGVCSGGSVGGVGGSVCSSSSIYSCFMFFTGSSLGTIWVTAGGGSVGAGTRTRSDKRLLLLVVQQY